MSEPGSSMTGEEVVVSGISGRFPKSENVKQFMDNLYSNVDMVESCESRYDFLNPDTPKHLGIMSDMKHFDAQFFRVPSRQALTMDRMIGKVLENTFGAIFDAGINPATLAGKKVGVFVGSGYTDVVSMNVCKTDSGSNYIVSGCNKAMLANRISYWLDSKGTSVVVDSICSSSSSCLALAYQSIMTGQSECAIVGGCNYCVSPTLSLNLNRAGLLSSDGKTKVFDETGDGFVRSEAVSILFLQKAKYAKRIYTEVCYVKEKYFLTPDASFLPLLKPDDVVKFLEEFYCDVDVDPKCIEYIEANGIGIPHVDRNELKAIQTVFGSKDKVMVGSLKSNMGNSECASGACNLLKLCLAYQTGMLPANLHHNKNTTMIEDNIEILAENKPFNRSLTAINSFSLNGLNSHALLKGHYKPKDTTRYKTDMAKLILASGRSEICCENILNHVKNNPIDPEQISLLHDIFKHNVSGYLARGYVILDSTEEDETVCLSESVSRFEGVRPPVWLLYSGMGSQWPGMGEQLLKIPTFATSIERCRKALEPLGLDIIKIITDKDEHIFDDILNSFVGIAAIQIGLTDILRELQIVPDNIIGHSVGELGSAYADGCVTAEEMILLAYYRGLVSKETKFIKGLMAAVKLGYKDVEARCPPEVEAVCHNSSEFTTISGPADIVEKFISDLTRDGIFAKKVNTSNIAYHSRYIAEAGPHLINKTKDIIKKPQLRSSKWICTSLLPSEWRSAKAKFASAEYFTNNLLSHVYFEEAARFIPDGALVIEVAPRGLMQAIIRKSHKNCVHVPLTKSNHPNQVNHLLNAIGKLYENGLNPHIDVLYPKVEYPVSTETPSMTHYIDWEHSVEWPSYEYKKPRVSRTGAREVIITVPSDEWQFLSDYKRDGVNVCPESAYLVLVWKTFAMNNDKNYTNLPVIFEDVKFHKEIVIDNINVLKLNIDVKKVSGRFEVQFNGDLIVSGSITQAENNILKSIQSVSQNESVLNQEAIYKKLERKGYVYKNSFKGISHLSRCGEHARVSFGGQWTTFLDCFLQLHLLTADDKDLLVPKFIKKLYINPDITELNADSVDVEVNTKLITYSRCSIVSLDDVKLESKTNKNSALYSLENKAARLRILEETVKVAYVGLYNEDISESKPECNKNDYTSLDFSGTDNKGVRIMGLVSNDELSNNIFPDSSLRWAVPHHWSLQEAATVPLPYIHAYYCLMVKGELEENMKVFITDGVCTFGQAVLSICLSIGYEVYVAVNNEEERHFILKRFRQLQDANVIDCDEYMNCYLGHHTGYTFCDIVVNTSANTWIRQVAMHCVSVYGKFLDLSNSDKRENSPFGMKYLTCCRQYLSPQLSVLLEPEHKKDREVIQNLIEEGLMSGCVQPLSRPVYTPNDIEKQIESYRNEVTAEESSQVEEQRDNDEPISLKTLFSFIQKKGWIAAKPYVIMPTPLQVSSLLVKGEINPADDYLIMIPGFEGHPRIFRDMCQHLKIQALGVQLGADAPRNTISDIAKHVYQSLKNVVNMRSKFYILGYSFGVNVALELAALIEAEHPGSRGVVYCVDSSPDVLKIQLRPYLDDLTTSQLQDEVINHVIKILTNDDEADIDLSTIVGWEDKIGKFIVALKDKCGCSHEYAKLVVESLYQRLLLAKEYSPDMRLRARVVLVAGAGRPLANYGLGKYCEHSVTECPVPAHHASILNHWKVADIVNNTLDNNILEKYSEKNLCISITEV